MGYRVHIPKSAVEAVRLKCGQVCPDNVDIILRAVRDALENGLSEKAKAKTGIQKRRFRVMAATGQSYEMLVSIEVDREDSAIEVVEFEFPSPKQE